jgi:hypothetical protein
MHRYQLFRVRKRQGSQQNAIDEAIDSGCRADAKSKGENCSCREARRFTQLAQSEVKVGTERC